MMSQFDPRSVVRIAIALAALKHKPRDQSIASYLLDLQSHFPVTTKDDDDREWRTYALELEKQLATLRAQRDADQELLSKLGTDASRVASGSDAPPPKKRSKKNPTKDQHQPGWSWDQTCADWSRYLSSQYPAPPSLIAAYASLKGALASPNADLASYASCLADAILRVLDTVHVFLFSPPNLRPNSQTHFALSAPLPLEPAHIDSTRIALVSPLLMYVLQTALHTLVHTAQDSSTKSKRQRKRPYTATLTSTDAHMHIDKVLSHLLECVLLALLRAITPLCFARLAPLLSVSPKKDKGKDKASRSPVGRGKDKDKRVGATPGFVDPPKKTDARTDVFALIGASLEALDALPPFVSPVDPGPGPGPAASESAGGSIAGSIRDRLGLETIRELEALYAVPAPVPPPSSACSREPPATPLESPLLPLPTPAPSPLSAPSETQAQTCSPPRHQHQPQTQQHATRLGRLAGTRAERVRALATRDAGWFLASTLNLCVSPAGSHGAVPDPAAGRRAETAGAGGTLLREALLDRIGKLVRSVPLGGHVSYTSPDQGQPSNSNAPSDPTHCSTTDAKPAIDAVCQNMLLATCERAMSLLASS